MVVIRTNRMLIYPVSIDKMKETVEKEQDEALKTAYKEMLDGCINHPSQYIWYALWNMELRGYKNIIVGNISFKGIDENGMIEIGYGINSEYENKGYMTEAIQAITRWASLQPEVNKIEAEAEEDNIASIRVLEKSNYIRTGKKGKEGIRFVWTNEQYKQNIN